MRLVIVTEGKALPNGSMLAKGALRVDRDILPVTLGANDGSIIGKAREFSRNEDTGEISFDIELLPEYSGLELDIENQNYWDRTMYCTIVEGDYQGILLRELKDGIIRQITFYSTMKIPKLLSQ